MSHVKYNDLEMAFDFVSAGEGLLDARAYVSRETGEIYWVTDDAGLSDEDVPEDVEESDAYVAVPSKQELNLGKALVLRFASRALGEDDYERVRDIFRRKGAYGRFKSLLESKGKLDEWHQFEEEATKQELIEWAETEGLTVMTDDSV